MGDDIYDIFVVQYNTKDKDGWLSTKSLWRKYSHWVMSIRLLSRHFLFVHQFLVGWIINIHRSLYEGSDDGAVDRCQTFHQSLSRLTSISWSASYTILEFSSLCVLSLPSLTDLHCTPSYLDNLFMINDQCEFLCQYLSPDSVHDQTVWRADVLLSYLVQLYLAQMKA